MRLGLFAVCLASTASVAADPPVIDRTIGKQPKYSGTPTYCLLAFGAGANNRVWLVRDGSTLYVDRNGNGDLTEANEAVAAPKPQPGDPEGAFRFEVGELAVGGKTHKGLRVNFSPMKGLADNPNVTAYPQVAAAVKKHPAGTVASLDLDVECEALEGGGIGGRVSYMVSLFDRDGVFRFADTAADAPVVRLDGPLQIDFYAATPTWRGGRAQDAVLCVGTPGVGPGTFAMVKYEGLVPPNRHPTADVRFAAKDKGREPVKELFELKERC